MSNLPSKSLREYSALLGDVKLRIRHAQARAILAANAEMIQLYWDVGNLVLARQHLKGWGKSVIPRLSRDIRTDLPEVKGFSERNIGYMIRFAKEYPILQQPVAKLTPDHKGSILHQPGAKLLPAAASAILQQPVAKLPDNATTFEQLIIQMPWGHNVILIEKVKDRDSRLWYMQQTIKNGWSRNTLLMMIENQAHRRQGKAISNFTEQLPPPQSDLVTQAFKDPYIFDFLTLEEPFHERELETQLLRHLEKFLIELGQGFAFVGRQYPIEVDGDDFRIDLLFYHLYLRCYLVIDLKTGAFKAEYAGKMNFYLNVVDDKLRHPADSPSVGLILCQKRNRVVAEYALRGMKKPIGISEYELTRALPKELRSSLPSIKEIEAELAPKSEDAGKSTSGKNNSVSKRRRKR